MSDQKGNERQVPNLTTFKVLPELPVEQTAVKAPPPPATKQATPLSRPVKPVVTPPLPQPAAIQTLQTEKVLKAASVDKEAATSQEAAKKAKIKPQKSKATVTARRKAAAKHSRSTGAKRVASKSSARMKPLQSVQPEAKTMKNKGNKTVNKTKAVAKPPAVSGKESPNFFGTKMFGIDLGYAVSKEIDGVMKLANENCADAVQAGTVLSKGFEDVGKHMADYVKRSVESGVGLSRVLLHATTVKDIISLHADFTKYAVEDFVNESKKIADISFKASTASVQPVKVRAEKNFSVLYGPLTP